jgi:anti-sigma regulatory factor (Ser/Thr protein kinase)
VCQTFDKSRSDAVTPVAAGYCTRMAKDPFPPAGQHGGSRRALEMSAAGPADIAAARRVATVHLRGAGVANVDNAVLVLSELVTNAVLHAGGADRIVVGCSAGWVHISVHDRKAGQVHPRNDAAVGGHGLRIVDRVAENWGSRPLDGGKAVWARVAAAPAH